MRRLQIRSPLRYLALTWLGSVAIACSSSASSSPEPQAPDKPAEQAVPVTPEIKPEPPKPTVPSWDEIVERFKPTPGSLGEIFYDMSRHACTRAAECGNKEETIFECVARSVSTRCNQVDCSAPTQIDREHENFTRCVRTLLDLPCGEPGNRLECKVPAKQNP